MKRKALSLLLISLLSTGLIYSSNQNAYAHTFSGDESASFLALIHSIEVEVQLAGDNINNATMAHTHATHAVEHLDDHTLEEIAERNERIARDLPAALASLQNLTDSQSPEVNQTVSDIEALLGEAITVRVEREQLNNSTVQALTLANLADGVLEHYAEAMGIEGGDHNTTEHGESEHDEGAHNTTSNDDHNMTDSSTTHEGEHPELTKLAHYHSAHGLALKAQQIFEDLRPLAPANSTTALAELETGLADYTAAIENRSEYTDVQAILHNQVHPNIQTAFNLQIVPEFPLPALLVIPALAGIIFANRFKLFKR